MRCLLKIASMSSCALPKKTCKVQLLCSYKRGGGGKGRVWSGLPASSVCRDLQYVCGFSAAR